MYYAPLNQAIPTAMDDVAPIDLGPAGVRVSTRSGPGPGPGPAPGPAGVGSMNATAVVVGGIALVGIWAVLRLGRREKP